MLNWKKKLGALVPGEARAHLQNALTVEWSGHKTVLVEVPQARDDAVELSGISGEGQYGRLMDDDEEQKTFVRPRLGRGRSSTTSGEAPAYQSYNSNSNPHAHARSESTPTYSSPYSPSPYSPYRYESDPDDIFASVEPAPDRRAKTNPFANPFAHDDDYAAAAATLPAPPIKASPTGPSRPPRPILPVDIWDNLGDHTSASSAGSHSTGSGSLGSPRSPRNRLR